MKNKTKTVKRTSLTEKMILYFLALGIGSIIVTGFFSFFTARSALLERTYFQLTSVRIAKQGMIERFLEDRLREASFFTTSEDAGKLAEALLSGNNKYTDTLVEKTRWFLASGYYSGFIILDQSGKALYKQVADSLTNHSNTLITGPTLINLTAKAFISDFPLSGQSITKQLLAICPIKSHSQSLAYLALIIDQQKIDEIMLEENPANGFGKSGETYLVGADYLMRSQSRFISNSVMKTRVMTIPVMKSFKNEAGVAQVSDYRGIEVLSSFGKIKVEGLNWAIIAELDYQEATASIYAIRNSIMLLTVFIALAFFFMTYAISRKITRPLIKLKDAAIELGEGKLSSLVGIESDDEIGELTEAFNRMAVNLQDKDQALKAERINRLKSAIDGQDQERQRLSRELHDGIGQNMIAIRLRLGMLETGIPDKYKLNLQSVIALTDSLIDEVRAISNALMPPSLAEFGLTSALRNLCNNLTETTNITTTFEGEIPGQLLGNKARLYIFRIFQEALNNVSKHSNATTLKIESQISNNLLYISIADNGKGFDTEASCNSKGHGLNNLRERASLLKGQAFIISEPGKGTTIKFEIPVNKSIL